MSIYRLYNKRWYTLICVDNQLNPLVDRILHYTAFQRIIDNEVRLALNTCVFNANLTNTKNAGGICT